jgi:hypothetical protein
VSESISFLFLHYNASSIRWATPLALFALLMFGDRVLWFCPEQPGPWSSYLCFPCSKDDRHVPLHPAISWDGILAICLGCCQTVILLIATFRVAGIVVMSQRTQSWKECCFPFLAVLGIESRSRTLFMLGRYSAIWTMPPAFFFFSGQGHFLIYSFVCPQYCHWMNTWTCSFNPNSNPDPRGFHSL